MEIPRQGGESEKRPDEGEWGTFIRAVDRLFMSDELPEDVRWKDEEIGKYFRLHRASVFSPVESRHTRLYSLHTRDIHTGLMGFMSFDELRPGILSMVGEPHYDAMGGLTDSYKENAELLLRMLLATHPSFNITETD